jgi:hypothetical protein
MRFFLQDGPEEENESPGNDPADSLALEKGRQVCYYIEKRERR